MPDKEKDVNAESSTDKTKGNPPQEGKTGVMPEGRTAQDVWAENQRKQEKIEKLEAEKSKYEAELEELRAKKEEEGLNANEELREDELEDQIRFAAKKLRTQKDTQPWIEVAKEEANLALLNQEINRANWYVEDKAVELKMKPKELAQTLAQYAVKYNHLPPERRNQLAFRDWQDTVSKTKSLEEREAAVKKAEDEAKSFRENGGRSVRQPTKDDKFEQGDKQERLRMAVDLIGTAGTVRG